jgi:hypothetical protein
MANRGARLITSTAAVSLNGASLRGLGNVPPFGDSLVMGDAEKSRRRDSLRRRQGRMVDAGAAVAL